MSIQKISSVIPKSNQNKFLKGISFKGFTTQDTKVKKAYIGTSGILNNIQLFPSDVNADDNYQLVTRGKQNPTTTTETISSHEVNYRYVFNTYHADPHEKISEEVEDNHTFIVEYKELPEQPTTEEILSTTKTSALRDIIDTMEEAVTILEAEDKFSEENVNKKKEALEIAKEKYQQAQQDLDKANDYRTQVRIDLADSKDKLTLAKSTFETAKEKEAAEYEAEERRRQLERIQTEIDKINSTADEQMQQIQRQRDEQLAKLEEMRKEIFGDNN